MQDVQWVRKVVQWALFAVPIGVLVWLWLPFLNAILLATVISILTNGPYQRSKARWEARLKRWRPSMATESTTSTMGALSVTVGTLFAIAIPLVLVGLLLAAQVNTFLQDFRAGAPDGQSVYSVDYIVGSLNTTVAPFVENLSGTKFDLKTWFDENRESLTRTIGQRAGGAAFIFGHGALMLVIAFLTSFFMLRDGHRLREPLLAFLPLPREDLLHMAQRVANTVKAVFVGVILVGVVQGTLAGVAYALAGIPSALMWGVATIVLCMIPLLGAPLVFVPMGLLLMSQGKMLQGSLLLAFGFGVVSQIDNLLKPLVIGARTQLHTMAVFFSLLGGVLVMGPIGLFAGPMVLAMVLSLYDSVVKGSTAPPPADATS